MSSLPGGLAGPGSGQQLLQALAGLLGNRPARRCLPAGLGRASPAASIAQVYGATEAVAAGKKISCEEAQEQVLSRDNLDENSGNQGALIHFRGDLAGRKAAFRRRTANPVPARYRGCGQGRGRSAGWAFDSEGAAHRGR
jgi:hypothetical protein